MIRRKIILLFLVGLFLISGCADSKQPVAPAPEGKQPAAGLQTVPPEQAQNWGVPGRLIVEGTENFSRIVAGEGLLAPQGLELAAGADSRSEYYLDAQDSDTEFTARFQFLSTQGIGRLSLEAFDRNGRRMATVGYVFTGDLPARQANAVWINRRLTNNYQGDWVEERFRPSDFFAQHLPGVAMEAATRYRLGIETGNGQHVLVTELKATTSLVDGVKASWQSVPGEAVQGDSLKLTTKVSNNTNTLRENVAVQLREPYGYGLVVQGGAEQIIGRLLPGETAILHWNVIAQRASAVNFGQPWELHLAVNQTAVPSTAKIHVTDPAAGKIFYVMTEDLEPMDAAGYPKAWGNQNGWLDAEEFRYQIIGKSEALNRIADKYGAHWTHYLAMPALEAAEWAATQSTLPNWRKVLDDITASVKAESGKGHEYGLHLHSDYDPEVPGNVLSYNPAVDGFWANHLKHGWASSFPLEGDSHERGSRTGILFHQLKNLSKLTEPFPIGEVLTARTGSFDFGNGAESEAMSVRAYRKAGLWGNTDADGNEGRLASGDFKQSVYGTPPDDINAPATNLKEMGLIEFRPTPRQPIMYDLDSAPSMNEKARQGMNSFMEGGKVRPGVQAIIGFTHAMFVMSPQGWKSTVGGQFQALDDHLSFLRREYVERGLLQFGTGTDLVRAYIDYYWPEPVVLRGPLLQTTPQGKEFALDFLGRNIPVDAVHQHNLTLQIPIRYGESKLWATLLKNGQPVAEKALKSDRPELTFVWDNRQDSYRLVIGPRFVRRMTASDRQLFEAPRAPEMNGRPWTPQPDTLLQKEDRSRFQ